jgi:hypothetical protein
VTSVNVPSAPPAGTIGGRMLFSPSAHSGGAAAPTAWRLAVTEGEPLFLQLGEAQESALAASSDLSDHQHQGERVARGLRMTRAATDEFPGWAKGIGADGNDPRVQTVMELSGANLQPRLTGPLLPREQAPQGRTGLALRCVLRVGYPMYRARAMSTWPVLLFSDVPAATMSPLG